MSLCSHILTSSSHHLVESIIISNYVRHCNKAQGSNDESRKWGTKDCQLAGCPGFLSYAFENLPKDILCISCLYYTPTRTFVAEFSLLRKGLFLVPVSFI